jgi:hypothetical protein
MSDDGSPQRRLGLEPIKDAVEVVLELEEASIAAGAKSAGRRLASVDIALRFDGLLSVTRSVCSCGKSTRT